MADLAGSTLQNRYRVDSFIGRGGMADVYKIWDQNRAVYLAMKVLHSDLAEDRAFLRRFKREAETLAKLQHPHIVRSYGLETDGRLAFILMDYIDGVSLRTRIFDLDRPFTSEEVLEIMQPVCAALHYAHQSGVVHCDIKPANIMIHKNGTVLVSDFGISRITEAATATMVGAGTPAYMSPEQARGQDLTPQSDIYSLGIVLYEMLSGGERPFTGERAKTTGGTSEKIRWEQMNATPPPLRKVNPQISPVLEDVTMTCLQKDATKRYQSALAGLNVLIQAMHSVTPEQALPKVKQIVQVTESLSEYDIVESNSKHDAPTPNKPELGSYKRNRTLLFIGAVLLGLILFFIVVSHPSNVMLSSAATYIPTITSTFVAITSTPFSLPTSTFTPEFIATASLTPSSVSSMSTPPDLLVGNWLVSFRSVDISYTIDHPDLYIQNNPCEFYENLNKIKYFTIIFYPDGTLLKEQAQGKWSLLDNKVSIELNGQSIKGILASNNNNIYFQAIRDETYRNDKQYRDSLVYQCWNAVRKH